MTAQKQPESGGTRDARSAAPSSPVTGRKPWKKKTPVDVVLDQINRVRGDVLEREEELKQAKRQLQKLEEAKKVLEAS